MNWLGVAQVTPAFFNLDNLAHTMAHISRLRKKRFDMGKLQKARADIFKEHCQKLEHNIEATRKASAAEAKRTHQEWKDNGGMRGNFKPIGVFSYDELVLLKLRYGEDAPNDPELLKFWRKASGQEFLLHA